MRKTKDKSKNQKNFEIELENVKSQLARALADYDNFRKRVEREKDLLSHMASLGIIAKVITIVDMLEQAQKHLNDQGLAIAIGEMEKIFHDEGVEKLLVSKGDPFDQELYEAVESVETKDKKFKGKVAEMLLPGYKYREGYVVRHAKVKVYR
jgi:molecular chaperone GrpE